MESPALHLEYLRSATGEPTPVALMLEYVRASGMFNVMTDGREVLEAAFCTCALLGQPIVPAQWLDLPLIFYFREVLKDTTFRTRVEAAARALPGGEDYRAAGARTGGGPRSQHDAKAVIRAALAEARRCAVAVGRDPTDVIAGAQIFAAMCKTAPIPAEEPRLGDWFL